MAKGHRLHLAPNAKIQPKTVVYAASTGEKIVGGRYLLIFITLVVLGLTYRYAQAAGPQSGMGNVTVPGGTIPGGTIPPPPTEPTKGQIRVLHLAPIAEQLEDTAIDICTGIGAPVAGLTGLRYLENSGYLAIEPGSYSWAVGTPGCTTLLYELPPFASAAGSISTILITGGANGQPLTTIFVVDQLGQFHRLYLPLINK